MRPSFSCRNATGASYGVDDGADAGEQDADEEDHADDTAAGHAVEDVDKVHEHEAGAALGRLNAAGCHGREDDERREQSRDGIKDRNVAGGGRDILALAEVGAVNHGAVAGNGQGEERLTEGIHPDLDIEETGGFDGEDVAVALAEPGRNAMYTPRITSRPNRAGIMTLLAFSMPPPMPNAMMTREITRPMIQPHAVAESEEAVAEHHADGFAEGGRFGSRHAERAADGARASGAEGVQAAGDAHPAVLEDPAHNGQV